LQQLESQQTQHTADVFLFLRVSCSYEAWIIYNFSALLLAYVGGPGAVVVKAEGKIVHPSWPHLTCCLPAMQVRTCSTHSSISAQAET
jgi:hypothetical protein